MNEILKPLDYQENYKDLIPEGNFRISPSSLYKFSKEKHNWFRSEILGERVFEANTSTILGTCVHRCAEVFTKFKSNEERSILHTELPEYINSFKHRIDLDVNLDYILEQYKPMGQALMDYLAITGIPEKSEDVIAAKLMDGVYVGGTADAVIGDILIDYKTTSKANPELIIPNHYKWQMLAYAWVYNKLGIPINTLRIIWITTNQVNRISEKTGKYLKDYPTQIIPVNYQITTEDMDFIEDYLKLIGETYLKYKQDPNLAYLLFSDYRLKQI